MARNIEVKMRVASLQPVQARADAVADRGPFTLTQVDHFFPVTNGRLKLRIEQSDMEGHENKSELIAYQRSDKATARASDYLLFPTNDPELLRTLLVRSLGEGPVVSKTRHLYLVGRTRIHLDAVEGLGSFVEIEVVMEPDEDEHAGQDELKCIVSELGLSDAEVVEVAYADLL